MISSGSSKASNNEFHDYNTPSLSDPLEESSDNIVSTDSVSSVDEKKSIKPALCKCMDPSKNMNILKRRSKEENYRF